MRIEKRDIIYVILIVGLFIFLGGYSKVKALFRDKALEKETTTTTQYITKKQLDSLTDFIVSNQKKTRQRIIIKNDKVSPVDVDYKLTKEDIQGDSQLKEVGKYQDTITLGNGTIYSEIYADKLYGKKFSLATTDTIISKVTLEKQTINSSTLFYGIGSTFGLDGRIKDIEASINYTHKGRFYIEGGIQYDIDPLIHLTPNKRTGLQLKVGFNF